MDTPWNRALGFPASLMRHAERMNSRAAQHRRAVELPSGKIVEFEYPRVDDLSESHPACEYLRRQALPVGDPRDPREVGA
jgi:hypothetical protein